MSPWSNSTSSTIPWGQLSTTTEQGDIDFVYEAKIHGAMIVSDDAHRNIPVLSSVISSP